jgi:hypothetical protein
MKKPEVENLAAQSLLPNELSAIISPYQSRDSLSLGIYKLAFTKMK